MKNIFILLLFFVQTSFAQELIIVTHTNGTSTPYTDLHTANSNFQDGDYVYLSGGVFSLNNSALLINKRVHIIGGGHNPDSTLATGTTNIFMSGSQTAIRFDANGSSIEGISINSGYSLNINTSIDSITISRCRIDILTLYNGQVNPNSSNIFVKECVITQSLNLSNNGVVLKNNIFNCSINGSGQSCHFENNIFLNSNIGLAGLNSDFKFNIFISNNAVTGAATNSFEFNVFSLPTTDNSMSAASNYTGDTASVVPSTIFTDAGINGSTLFLYSHNFTIPITSAAHLIDGVTDAGIYAGTFSWKAGSVPYNPHIFNATIPGSVDVNGMLNINIKVAGQDH